jgi:predicted peptidase
MITLFACAALVAAGGSAAMPPAEVVARFEEHGRLYTGGEYTDEVFKYRLLKPASLEKGKQYPVVLFLHGAGERGDDNQLQLLYLPEQMSQPEFRERYPCFLIAPQCREGKLWVEVPWSDPESTPMQEPGDQMRVVIGILNHVLEAYPADKDRVYLTGLSMGGYGSWDLAARHPELFAAVVPICGGGDERAADRLVDVPIWAVHGDMDTAVPVVRSRTMIEAIKKAGGHPRYSELKGVGHNSWTPAYSDPDGVLPWMFQQSRKKQPSEQ